MIAFDPGPHKYTSIVPDGINWTSVTKLLGLVKEPFDKNKISTKSSKNTKSKWYGLNPKQIQDIWEAEKDRSIILGNWYHNQREDDVLEYETIKRYGETLPVIRGMTDHNGMKIASSQRLFSGIYPEHMVYLKSAGACGQSDLVEVAGGKVHVTDYKSSKKIDRRSYVNWEGASKMLLHPLSHLEDCHFVHYQLQLSIYMYMILRHNPKLSPGNIIVQHVKFKIASETEYGYPIYEQLPNGDYVIESVEMIPIPYLKTEAETLLKHNKS